jgi:hypothetical protein
MYETDREFKPTRADIRDDLEWLEADDVIDDDDITEMRRGAAG